MKRTGIDHPKTKRLAKLLGVAHFSAVGILECVWHFTARHALCGDIGRWSDEEIADSAGWPAEDAGRLITALVDARWLDRHEQHRLIVHHWHDHCDESTKKTIKKHGWQFVSHHPNATVPESFANGGEPVATVPDSQSQSQSRSQAKASASANGDAANSGSEAVEAEFANADISEAVPLIKDARQRGYQTAELRSILAHQQQHRDVLGAGAVVFRIRNSPPGTPIDKGWPVPKGTPANSADDAHLESSFAQRVNAMKADELLVAMERAGIDADKLPHVRQVGTKIRGQLLRHLAGEARTSTPAPNAKPPPAVSSGPKTRTDAPRR